MTTFRQLQIGQTFDWVDDRPGAYNSFFLTCKKTSARTYVSLPTNVKHQVGSINAEVFHVEQVSPE